MEFEEISSKIPLFVKKYWLALALSILGILFILYGLISLVSNKPAKTLEFSQNDSGVPVASKSASIITIDIEGAVVEPGVYRVSLGSILQDALILAKGMAGSADRDFVAKNINLASKLTDGQKIYIPKIGEKSTVQVEGASTVSATGLININAASAKDLDSLPGVGLVTAEKIISQRPYINIDDLLSKKIVSSKVFGEIKDKISVY